MFLGVRNATHSSPGTPKAEERKHMRLVLLIILVVLLLGALPTWPYSAGWGYYPSGGLGLVLLIVLILAVLGKI
jgi:Protein of unknown function (DUF3309)